MRKKPSHDILFVQQRDELQVPSGFTLVEMLVVICIIAILGAFLITATLNSLTRSKRAKTKALIKKVENGLRTYETDNQTIPEPAETLTIKKGKEWVDIKYPDTLKGQSAQLHGLLGARIRKVHSVDPTTGRRTYTEAGPYVNNFEKSEIQDGEKENFKKPIIDAWENVLRVRFDGWDHSSKPNCGNRNNEGWVDIWSEGPRIEEDMNDGCNEDDINNFGTEE